MKYLNIAGAATTTVCARNGTLVRLVINKAVANSVVTIYDNTTNSGALIATITQPAAPVNTPANVEYEVEFQKGLTIVTSAADDLTVVWTG